MHLFKNIVLLSAVLALAGFAIHSGALDAASTTPGHHSPLRADGGKPVPDPWVLADGGKPVPDPWMLLADGGKPVPDPWMLLADGGKPVPDPWMGVVA